MQNNANDISITILETPEDIEQSRKLIKEYEKKNKTWLLKAVRFLIKTADILFVFALIFLAAACVLYFIEKEIVPAMVCLLCTIGFSVYYGCMKRRSSKTKNANALQTAEREMDVKYPNGIEPTNIRFSDDSLTLSTAHRMVNVRFSDLYLVVEFAEGLLIGSLSPYVGHNIWIPARFMTKQSAARVTELLEEKKGRKYKHFSAVMPPEYSEKVSAPQFVKPEGEAFVTIEEEPENKVVLVKRIVKESWQQTKSLIIFFACLMFFFVVSGMFKSVFGTAKTIIKVIRLIAKYTELGQVISQSDMMDTVQRLLITLVANMVYVSILLVLIAIGAAVIRRIFSVISWNMAAKPARESHRKCSFYTDVIVSKTAETMYIIPWKNVQKAVQSKSHINIWNKGRIMQISRKAMGKEKEPLLFEMLTERLGRNWHKPQAVLTASENAVYKADTYGTKTE